MMLKSLLLAGFMFTTALAVNSEPPMATLQVQSNFDFSLTRKEFRVHYSGLGGFTTTESVSIKIYKMDPESEIHTFTVENQDKPEIYQFALGNAEDGKYAVEVCAGDTCSPKNAALTDISPVNAKKITCERVVYNNGKFENAAENFQEDFFGPKDEDWIDETYLKAVEQKIHTVSGNTDYQTEYTKLSMSKNPQYKLDDKMFYAAVTYDIKKFKPLFDKAQKGLEVEGTEYAHELCERKYLLSAHAHIVDEKTKEVKHRFKTTLFLSEGGKQMFVLSSQAQKVHVEMVHKGETIKEGKYHLWITFCATEKDAIESTFCADPLIKEDFLVSK